MQSQLCRFGYEKGVVRQKGGINNDIRSRILGYEEERATPARYYGTYISQEYVSSN